MGTVYLAFTPGGRPVALKAMRPELAANAAFRDRFRQEADAARRVHGLYTAQVLDADPDADPGHRCRKQSAATARSRSTRYSC
jgi:hypothetical protein